MKRHGPESSLEDTLMSLIDDLAALAAELYASGKLDEVTNNKTTERNEDDEDSQ